MDDANERFVPKVHPATRAVEAEDPMLLVAEPAAGDPRVMLECLVQEFAWMGLDLEQLVALFDSPMYPVLNQLKQCFPGAQLRENIARLLGQTGVLRVTELVDDEPSPEDGDDEPHFVSLTLPPNPMERG